MNSIQLVYSTCVVGKSNPHTHTHTHMHTHIVCQLSFSAFEHKAQGTTLNPTGDSVAGMVHTHNTFSTTNVAVIAILQPYKAFIPVLK